MPTAAPMAIIAGSELSSEGKPVDERERTVLGDAAARLRPDFIDGSYRLPVSDGSGRDRKVLRKAVGLLAEAGWTVTDKGLTNAAGEPFAFTITVQNRDQEKIALHYQRTLQGHRHQGGGADRRLGPVLRPADQL